VILMALTAGAVAIVERVRPPGQGML